MSNQKPSEDSSRRNFLSAAAVVASAAVAAPTVANAQPGPNKKPRGIYADSALTDKIADFSYQSDALAEMIVRAWSDATYKAQILTSAGAKTELAARGFSLKNPIVIEESTYVNGYYAPADAVVFVIPDPGRITTTGPLLETAKMLMAVTPNGI